MSHSYMGHSSNGIFYTTTGSFHKRATCKAKFVLLLKKDPGIIQQSYVIQGLGFVLYSNPEALTLPLQQKPAFVCMCVFGGATQSNTIQRTATHGNTLQHTATHCNTLQHTGGGRKKRIAPGFFCGKRTAQGLAYFCKKIRMRDPSRIMALFRKEFKGKRKSVKMQRCQANKSLHYFSPY